MEAGRDDPDQVGGGQHAGQHQHRRRQRQDRAHRAGHAPRFFLVAFRQQARVHRDEGRGEHAFAEQVLQNIGDPEGRGKGIRRVREPEVMPKDALPHQPDHAAEQDAGRHEEGVPAGTFALGRHGHRPRFNWFWVALISASCCQAGLGVSAEKFR